MERWNKSVTTEGDMRNGTPRLDESLTGALDDAPVLPRDAATVALARRYAALIDAAEQAAVELDQMTAEDESQALALTRLRAAVDAQTVASDLGPKLLAALAALGMAPSARGDKGGGAAHAHDPAVDALAALRARRAASGQR